MKPNIPNMNRIEIEKAKLLRRAERVIHSSDNLLLFNLRNFWGHLEVSPIFRPIIIDAENANQQSVNFHVTNILNASGKYLENEVEKFAVYTVLFKTLLSPNKNLNDVRKIIERHVGPFGNEAELVKKYFLEIYFLFFLDILIEKLNDKELVLHSLVRFKQECEWFRSAELSELYELNKSKGEKKLAQQLYRYLFNEGIELYIEPSSTSGEIDLIADQKTKNKLLIEAKIFNGKTSKKSIINGFQQIYNYCNDYNENIGYLIIFKTCEDNLQLNLDQSEEKLSFCTFNNKLIYFLLIDIHNYEKSASKRGELNPIILTKDELININE